MNSELQIHVHNVSLPITFWFQTAFVQRLKWQRSEKDGNCMVQDITFTAAQLPPLNTMTNPYKRRIQVFKVPMYCKHF